MNPYAESWVSRAKREVLDHFIVFGEGHFGRILEAWITYYHIHRPHQGLGNVPISASLPPPDLPDDFSPDDIVCHERLGGLLKCYERKAA